MKLLDFFRALVVCAVAGLVTASPAQERFDFETTPSVLPKTVVPSHYRLALDLDPRREAFSGRTTITVDVREHVPAVLLHAQGLTAHRARLVGTDGRTRALAVNEVKRMDSPGLWRLAPRDGRLIAAGAWRLEIDYRGRVNRTGMGLYRAEYRVGGQPATMLATQLQAANARMLFPGFDEPLFRATFEIEVTAPAGFEVLSNQPRVAREAAPQGVRHRFAQTPPMPGYLVAVAVGRFDVLEGQAEGVPLRIFTAEGKGGQAQFAMAATQQLLPYFNRYFDEPYALPKLDQIAVPAARDGAMEDWGLISYIENALLVDAARSSPNTRRQVYNTVAHEIAHQWFGNLVSVSSWDEIWLNEAFATWLATKATEHFNPQWQSRLGARAWVDSTMERDATAATRAIRSGPLSESRVFDVFDGITYAKGGAVLSMLEQWIGEAAFQRGLAAYMRERRLSSARAGDLWHHVGRAAGADVARVAATWTNQPGYPLVSASLSCEQGHTVLTLRQQRFSFGAGAVPATAAEPLWHVPVRVARGSELHTPLLDAPERRIEWPACDTQPLVVNAGARGFYRVAYDDALRARLLDGFASLAGEDQVMLLADSFMLAQAGRQPLVRHFDWLMRLPSVQGAARAPAYAMAVRHLEAIDRLLAGSPSREAVQAAARALLAPELARLGWSVPAQEDPEATRLRGTLIAALARLGDAEVAARAREHFAAALAPAHGAGRLHPSLRGAIFKAVGRAASAEEFAALFSALRATDSMEERWTLLAALAAGRDAARAERLLAAALEGWLPPNVAREVPDLLAQEPEHAQRAYAFSVASWSRLAPLAGNGVFGERAWLLPGASATITDAAHARRLREDQRRLVGPSGSAAAEQVAARIEVRAAWREREAARLATELAGWRPLAP